MGQLYSDLGGVFYCLFGNVTRRVFYCWGAFRGADAESVYRADDTLAPEPIEDMGVDHRRLDILVAE